MATSDSEDFESADEWDDGSKKSPNLKTPNSLSLDAKKSQTVTRHENDDIKSNTISEDLEKKLCIEDSKVDSKSTEVENPATYQGHTEDKLKPESESSSTKIVEENTPSTELHRHEHEVDNHVEGMIENEKNEEKEKPKINTSIKHEEEAISATTDSGSSWSGWGSWGVTSLLSTATESVTALTSQVSQGLSTVLETGLGVPNPEDLARQEKEEEKKVKETSTDACSEVEPQETKAEEHSGLFGFGRVMSGVSSITKLVESAGTKVVSGGLDTLESIGKKTMEVLQDGDPGLRKKRALFKDKVVLSQILREAKEKAEEEDKLVKNREEARKAHFETLFDDYQGLVHLEALEMLSKQCDIKVQSCLLNKSNAEIMDLQQALSDIKEMCQLPDDEEVDELGIDGVKLKLAHVGEGLSVHVANDKFTKTWDEIQQWIGECMQIQQNCDEDNGAPTAREIHQKSIDTLARLTAESVEQFHKIAELLLVHENRRPLQEAKILLDMTLVLSSQISTTASAFSERLNACTENSSDTDVINAHITNVFLEAANSSSYIQEAFLLLIPILQVGVISS